MLEKLLKILLLVSAGVTVILRLFAYNNSSFMDESTVKLLNMISIISAVLCAASALIWIIILKLREKRDNG